MKNLLLLSVFILSSTSVIISQPEKVKDKNKEEKVKNKEKDKDKEKIKSNSDDQSKKSHDDIIWGGTKDRDGGGPKPSKNQPAKVRAAFAKDYPNATNVSWSKYRGDWTATFNQGFVRSTAVYHANGRRKDTRTPVERRNLPGPIDDIFKKKPTSRVEDIIRIDLPGPDLPIYRVRVVEGGATTYRFYNAKGVVVRYTY